MSVILLKRFAVVAALGALLAWALLLGLGLFGALLPRLEGGLERRELLQWLLEWPALAVALLPFALPLGLAWAWQRLHRRGEWLAARALGLSPAWGLAGGLGGAAVVVLFGLILAEQVQPRAEAAAARLEVTRGDAEGLMTAGAAWLRQGNDLGGQDVLAIGQSLGGRVLLEIQRYRFDGDGRLREVTLADRATLTPRGWQLEGVERTVLDAERVRAEVGIKLEASALVAEAVLPSLRGAPERLPLPELSAYLQALAANDVRDPAAEHAFWTRLTLPLQGLLLAALALVLVGPGQYWPGGALPWVALAAFAVWLGGRLLGQWALVADWSGQSTALAQMVVLAGVLGAGLLIAAKQEGER